MHIFEKILNNTTPYGKIRASHEGSLHSSTLNKFKYVRIHGIHRKGGLCRGGVNQTKFCF